MSTIEWFHCILASLTSLHRSSSPPSPSASPSSSPPAPSPAALSSAAASPRSPARGWPCPPAWRHQIWRSSAPFRAPARLGENEERSWEIINQRFSRLASRIHREVASISPQSSAQVLQLPTFQLQCCSLFLLNFGLVLKKLRNVKVLLYCQEPEWSNPQT